MVNNNAEKAGFVRTRHNGTSFKTRFLIFFEILTQEQIDEIIANRKATAIHQITLIQAKKRKMKSLIKYMQCMTKSGTLLVSLEMHQLFSLAL